MFIFIFKTFHVILCYLQNTHITYIIFKAYKKTNENIFHNFFSSYKNNKQISKTQRMTPKRSTQKISKSVWRRKRQKGNKRLKKDIKILLRKKKKKCVKKQKWIESRRNYNLAHKK